MPEYVRESRVEAAPAEVFAWHGRPGALERLIPPWERVRVIEREGGLHAGSRVVLESRIGPVRQRWTARHTECEENASWRDEAESGPFRRWSHTHRFEPVDEGRATRMTDLVTYELPFGRLGATVGGAYARDRIDRMFRHRHLRVREDLARHAEHAARPRLRVAITGASGLVGSALAAFLSTGGHDVVPVVRRPARPGSNEVPWNPAFGILDAKALEGLDAVVHLAGESIAGARWTAGHKREILESRRGPTRLLAETLARLERPPATLLCASAVGYYGDRDDELLTEDSAPGDDFLARVCQAWEDATRPAEEVGIRVARLRLGIVLSPSGGALRQLLLPARLGAGGPIGRGRPWWSWIALDDAVGALHHALMEPHVKGAVNVVAPEPVRQAAFARTLGRVLRRPAFAPVPPAALRLALGEMADALLLPSQRVAPVALRKSGFQWLQPTLEGALRRELGLWEGEAE